MSSASYLRFYSQKTRPERDALYTYMYGTYGGPVLRRIQTELVCRLTLDDFCQDLLKMSETIS